MRLSWPETMLSHSGVFASPKSASHTFAPELSALMVIFRSVGPVISTRRSTRPGAGAATRHPGSSRMAWVAGRQQLRAPRAELPLQRGHQADRARGENLVETVPHRTGDLHALAGHTALLPGHPPPRGHRAMLLASNDGGRCQSRALLILGFVTLRPGTGQSVPGHIPGTTWAARVFIEVSVSRRHDSIGRPLDRTACTQPR